MEGTAQYERAFRRAGLPLFIEDYSATEDVFTRALPFLSLVFLVLVVGALNLEWPVWANVLAVVGGALGSIGAFGLLNVARGRPLWSRPTRVGVPELAAFVLLPSLLPLVFGGQIVSAAVTAASLVALLGVVYLVVGFGVLSILRWAGVRLLGQLASSGRLLMRAIPLLMVFSLVIFLTTESWQVFSSVPLPFLGLIAGLFVALGTLFLLARLPAEVGELERDAAGGAPLHSAQRVNVGLVLFVSQALQVLVVSLGVGIFFTVVGALAVNESVRTTWIGGPGHVLLEFGLFGYPVQVTEELLRVSGAIAAFSGLYYAIAMLVDAAYRNEFLIEVTAEMQATFAARREYLELLSRRGDAVDADAP